MDIGCIINLYNTNNICMKIVKKFRRKKNTWTEDYRLGKLAEKICYSKLLQFYRPEDDFQVVDMTKQKRMLKLAVPDFWIFKNGKIVAMIDCKAKTKIWFDTDKFGIERPSFSIDEKIHDYMKLAKGSDCSLTILFYYKNKWHRLDPLRRKWKPGIWKKWKGGIDKYWPWFEKNDTSRGDKMYCFSIEHDCDEVNW